MPTSLALGILTFQYRFPAFDLHFSFQSPAHYTSSPSLHATQPLSFRSRSHCWNPSRQETLPNMRNRRLPGSKALPHTHLRRAPGGVSRRGMTQLLLCPLTPPARRGQGARLGQAYDSPFPPSVCSILPKATKYFIRIKSVYGILSFYVKYVEHKSRHIALFSHTPFKRMERARDF
ncbi:MAG: hypothetical protein A4E62_01791 [Syntrophorhabdus sp. PtaU1.Bin002]|nr:MAG: hypothetical protein A4E62_01791 [Syntrophorhabdus sp. PtaU1.Bin002]